MNYVSNTHLNRHKWRLAAKHYLFEEISNE